MTRRLSLGLAVTGSVIAGLWVWSKLFEILEQMAGGVL